MVYFWWKVVKKVYYISLSILLHFYCTFVELGDSYVSDKIFGKLMELVMFANQIVGNRCLLCNSFMSSFDVWLFKERYKRIAIASFALIKMYISLWHIKPVKNVDENFKNLTEKYAVKTFLYFANFETSYTCQLITKSPWETSSTRSYNKKNHIAIKSKNHCFRIRTSS